MIEGQYISVMDPKSGAVHGATVITVNPDGSAYVDFGTSWLAILNPVHNSQRNDGGRYATVSPDGVVVSVP